MTVCLFAPGTILTYVFTITMNCYYQFIIIIIDKRQVPSKMCLGKKLNHYTLGDKTGKSRPNRTNFSQNNFEHFLHRFLCLLHDVQNEVLYRCKIGGNCFHKPRKKQLGLRWSDVSIWLQLRLIAIELLAIRRIASSALVGRRPICR